MIPNFIPSLKLFWSPKLKSTAVFQTTTPEHAPTLSNWFAITDFEVIIKLTTKRDNNLKICSLNDSPN